MEIYKILVDEYPESCAACPFAKSYDCKGLEGRGRCLGLPEEQGDVVLWWYAKYRRHDCPLLKVKKVGCCEC